MELSGKNLFALSKLHESLKRLGPADLKAKFLQGPEIHLGQMDEEEAQQIRKAALDAGFDVRLVE